MRNGLRSTATAVALLAGVATAAAQLGGSQPPPAGAAQPPAQEEKEKQKARQQPAPSQLKQREQQPAAGQMQQRDQQPRQGTTQPAEPTPRLGGQPGPRDQVRDREDRPKQKATEQRPQAQPRVDRREQSGERRDRNERAGNRGRGDWSSLNDNDRRRIRESFRGPRMSRENLNFTISVGQPVPRRVRTYPVPRELWTIYPSYRRYVYIWIGDEILVINPRTNRIVAILPA